jgi:hypothetical protein
VTSTSFASKVVDRFSREIPFVRRAVSSLSAALLLLVPLTSCSSRAADSGADGGSGTTGEIARMRDLLADLV